MIKTTEETVPDQRHSSRLCRLAIVVTGLAVSQIILIGPSLIGQRILLPVDILKSDSYYIPSSQFSDPSVHNQALADRILIFEPRHRFASSELRAGRLPMWSPYRFAVAP